VLARLMTRPVSNTVVPFFNQQFECWPAKYQSIPEVNIKKDWSCRMDSGQERLTGNIASPPSQLEQVGD
jgi:hypothetical protein